MMQIARQRCNKPIHRILRIQNLVCERYNERGNTAMIGCATQAIWVLLTVVWRSCAKEKPSLPRWWYLTCTTRVHG
jgi:hypothetical protein